MKAHWKTPNGRLMIEVEGENQRECFRNLADAMAVFDAERKCGMCGSDDLHFRVRDVDKGSYYELNCRACQARFNFGQHMNSPTLWPKRVDDDGQPLPNGGWEKWQKPNGSTQPPAAGPKPVNGGARAR